MSIHAAAPAASAPGAPFSTGMIRSVNSSSVRYSCAVKVFGVYDPPAAACATAVMWCTSWAATRSRDPAAVSVSASRRRTSRRVISDIALPQFFPEVLGCAPRERDDGVGRILVGIADEHRAVGHEDVPHVVRLAVLVERAGFRIVAHAHRAHFVD